MLPAGVYKAARSACEVNTAYIYARDRWGAPIAHLPAQSKPVVAARFCPVLFAKGEARRGAGAASTAPVAAGGTPCHPSAATAGASPAAEAPEIRSPVAGEGAHVPGAAGLPFDMPYTMVFAVSECFSARVGEGRVCVVRRSCTGMPSKFAITRTRAHNMQVATLDSIILYSTNSWLPLALLGNLHYDSITDLAWSADGQYLAVASRDG